MKFITPNWNAPRFIHAFTSTRQGGVSLSPYDSLNLGLHVQDQTQAVLDNRNRVKQMMNLPDSICWLTQTHSANIIASNEYTDSIQADACYSTQAQQVCVVLTADCLPILVCHRSEPEISAIHAGWRGLAGGILQNTFSKLKHDPKSYLVWIGPSIRAQSYLVKQDMLDAFHAHSDPAMRACFTLVSPNQFQADLIAIATLILKRLGVEWISHSEHCTYSEPDLFFSARRDGLQSGRLASFIWIDHSN